MHPSSDHLMVGYFFRVVGSLVRGYTQKPYFFYRIRCSVPPPGPVYIQLTLKKANLMMRACSLGHVGIAHFPFWSQQGYFGFQPLVQSNYIGRLTGVGSGSLATSNFDTF